MLAVVSLDQLQEQYGEDYLAFLKILDKAKLMSSPAHVTWYFGDCFIFCQGLFGSTNEHGCMGASHREHVLNYRSMMCHVLMTFACEIIDFSGISCLKSFTALFIMSVLDKSYGQRASALMR